MHQYSFHDDVVDVMEELLKSTLPLYGRAKILSHLPLQRAQPSGARED